jgi:alpha-tubulin suppressor-like RCC1 family protein
MATTVVSGVQYSGIWNLSSQAGAKAAATWPSPPAYLYSWGINSSGSLGLNNTTNYSSPVQVGLLSTWSKISTSGNEQQVLLINKSGQMFGMGSNANARLGDGTTISRSSPTQIGSGTTWAQVATAFIASAAIKTDGTLWTWGNASEGGLGLNNTTYYSSPKQVGALTNWSKVGVAGGGAMVALKTDGTLWAWGANGNAGSGLNDIITRSSPVQIGALTTWSDFDFGDYNVAAIKTDGSLWVWGVNTYGQLGLSLTGAIVRSSPVQVGSEYNWAKASVGNSHMIALKTDGTMWGWGENYGGQLGNNDVIQRSSPVQVGALTSWSKVDSGHRFILAIKGGTLWAWGLNNGRSGTGTTADISSPTQVGSLSTWLDIAGGGIQSYAISSV